MTKVCGTCGRLHFRQAVSHCDDPRCARRLGSTCRGAPARAKCAQRALRARRCQRGAPLEKGAAHSRGRRGVARPLRRASGSRGRRQRPRRDRRSSGPRPSGGASRVSPRPGLSDAIDPSESSSAGAHAPTLRNQELRVTAGTRPRARDGAGAYFFVVARWARDAALAATAARISCLKAGSSIVSPSRRSIARRVFP